MKPPSISMPETEIDIMKNEINESRENGVFVTKKGGKERKKEQRGQRNNKKKKKGRKQSMINNTT